jgi:hypothetical protein
MSDIIDAKWAPEMDISEIFSELGGDCSVSIDRKEPEWCRGHIRRVSFDPKEPIDLDWISGKFGGEKLMVKLFGPKTSTNKSGYVAGRTIDIMGPPRDGHGIEMTQGPDGKACRVTELAAVMERHNQKMGIKRQSEAVPPVAAPALQNESLFSTMIQSQATQHAAMMEMMGQRVNNLEGLLYKQGTTQPVAPLNPIDQIKQTAEAMNLLRNMSGDFGDGGNNGDESLLSIIAPFVQGMFGPKNNNQPAPKGVLKAASPARVIDGPQKNPAKSLESLANNLSSLSAEDAAQVVFQAMGDMPDDKRQTAMASFMTRGSNMESNIDESLNQDNTNSQDVAELKDPFACSEGDPLPGQGRSADENAPNDQVDRPGDQAGI